MLRYAAAAKLPLGKTCRADHAKSRFALDTAPLHDWVYAFAFRISCALLRTDRRLGPTIETTGTAEMEALTSTFFTAVAQEPRKLHSLACIEYVYPFWKAVCGTTVGRLNVKLVTRNLSNCRAAGVAPSAVNTRNWIDDQGLLAAPADAVRSTVSELQPPMAVGTAKTTAG
jgi:hypothetical protein